MDITPQENSTQPMSDDQELAKALAGVLPDEPEEPAPESDLESDMQFEEIPAATDPSPAPALDPATAQTMPSSDTVINETVAIDTTDSSVDTISAPQENALETPAVGAAPLAPSGLEDIKNQALTELRPLIDHVDIPAEEKFDTYLMLLRSTDDASLIAPAHTAAQAISDEKRKAEALLDIIKEIDYLSRKDKTETAA